MKHLVFLLLSSIALAPLAGARPAGVQVELNKLEPRGESCQAYLVLENGTDRGFESLKLDLVLFDPDGIVAKRLAVETAPLPAGKTLLKVFELERLACGRVGRALLNGVLGCADDQGPRKDCLGLVSTTARGGMSFIK
jgi:hypothetical protein